MSGINGLGHAYASALRAFLETQDEAALAHAYEMGRQAMGAGLGVLDMAVVHGEALAQIAASGPASEQAHRMRAATSFFHELLSPFEMTFRGYRSANDKLSQLNETLRAQKEAVEVANRELEAFSYSVSHDLRAPLRSIDGFSQALLEEHAEKLDDDGKRYLGHVRRATQHMGHLIDGLLGLARVARTPIHRFDVDLSALATRIGERLQAMSPERSCTFRIEEGLHASADARLCGVVLENLLGNAWKFTSKRRDAEITFGQEMRDGAVVYFVRDNGAGFDMAYASKLFGAFQRLHSSKDFEGTGIGLATVQRVVARHEGRIWAESVVGEGTTFYFTLQGTAR